MRPAGSSTMVSMPALDAYADADAEVLPVEAQTTALAPLPAAADTASVMPRSLNDPVGLAPSTLTQVSQPSSADSCSARTRGVLPSPRVITGSVSASGSQAR